MSGSFSNRTIKNILGLYKKTLDNHKTVIMASNTYTANLSSAGAAGYKLDIIQFDPAELATILTPFLNQGSKPHYLTRDDITVYKVKYKAGSTIPAAERVDEHSSFSVLMSIGQNKFFDVLFYLSLDAADRPPMTEIQETAALPPLSSGDVCRALFVQYFFILTRGRVSNATGTTVGTDMPKFLVTVLGCSNSPNHYMESLATFDMHHLGYEWAQHVPFNGIAREAVSRFGLGVAGYRLLAPFRMLTPRAGLAANIQNAIRVAQSFSTSPASWEIHPATRSNQILQTYGPLNANLNNLMLEAYEPADLQALVTRKALFAMPTDDPSARHYRTWNTDYATPAAARIFP